MNEMEHKHKYKKQKLKQFFKKSSKINFLQAQTKGKKRVKTDKISYEKENIITENEL